MLFVCLFVSTVSAFLVLVFSVMGIWGLVKKNKKLKRISGFGWLVASIVFYLGVTVASLYSDS